MPLSPRGEGFSSANRQGVRAHGALFGVALQELMEFGVAGEVIGVPPPIFARVR
jgi:hypothetical protein